MSYGRETVMGGLRKAGTAIRDMDDAYSDRIRDMYEGTNPLVQVGAVMFGGGHPSFRKGEVDRQATSRIGKGAEIAMEYALPAINAVPKYVLPTAGVTVAGRGLMDIAAAFGGQADEPEPNQLPLS